MRAQQSTSICDVKFKIVFLGDMGVGKTSIIERFVKDQFDISSMPTVGIDFLCRNMTYNDQTYRLQLWDTAGQEKYKSLVPAYLKDAHCAVFVVDLCRPETLSNLEGWLHLFRDYQAENSIGFLLGNKTDLEGQRKIEKKQLVEFANKEDLSYEDVSAKAGIGINEAFTKILSYLNGKRRKTKNIDNTEFSDSFFEKYEKLRAGQYRNRLYCCYI